MKIALNNIVCSCNRCHDLPEDEQELNKRLIEEMNRNFRDLVETKKREVISATETPLEMDDNGEPELGEGEKTEFDQLILKDTRLFPTEGLENCNCQICENCTNKTVTPPEMDLVATNLRCRVKRVGGVWLCNACFKNSPCYVDFVYRNQSKLPGIGILFPDVQVYTEKQVEEALASGKLKISASN